MSPIAPGRVSINLATCQHLTPGESALVSTHSPHLDSTDDPAPPGPDPQPQGDRPRPAARPADRRDRRQRRGQELAGLRHALRRGPAALRRDLLGLHPAVPRAAGQARRRPDRGHPAGHRRRRARGPASSRSTVGTITEIHDYLAPALMPEPARSVCMRCGQPVAPATPPSVCAGDRGAAPRAPATRSRSRSRSCPVPTGGAGRSRCARTASPASASVERVETLTPDGPVLERPTRQAQRTVDVDRRPAGPRPDAPERRLDSIETAFAEGLGRCRLIVDGDCAHVLSAAGGAAVCGTDHPRARSPACSATTARSGPARAARGSAGSSTWTSTGSCRTARSRSARAPSPPGPRRRTAACSHDLLAPSPSLGIPVDVPFKRLDARAASSCSSRVPRTRASPACAGFFARAGAEGVQELVQASS